MQRTTLDDPPPPPVTMSPNNDNRKDRTEVGRGRSGGDNAGDGRTGSESDALLAQPSEDPRHPPRRQQPTPKIPDFLHQGGSGILESERSVGSAAAASAGGYGTSGHDSTKGATTGGSGHSIRSFLDKFRASSERRDAAYRKPGVGAAAFLIRDAVLGEVENPADGAFDPYASSASDSSPSSKTWRTALAILCARVCSSRAVLRLQYLVGAVLVALTFVEPPHWCRSRTARVDLLDDDASNTCFTYMTMEGVPASAGTIDTLYDSHNNDTTTITTTTAGDDEDLYQQYYPNSSSVLLTVGQSRAVDAACVAFLAWLTLLRIGRDGCSPARYFRPGSARVRRVLSAACLASMAVGLSTGATAHHPFARLVLAWCAIPHFARRDVHVVVGVVPELLNVLALLGVLMLFYAWFGNVMFVGTAEGREHFSSLVESMWTLYICVTTANYPDVMMPAYNRNRWTALYFVSFMMLSFFFLLNIILASIVNEYDEASAERKSEASKAADANLRKAFQFMDVHDDGRIDRETVMSLFAILNDDFPEFRLLSDDETKILFALLDQDGSSTITEDEFMNFGNVLLLEFIKASDYAPWVERWLPRLYHKHWYQRFCRVVKSEGFEKAVDCVLVLNAVIIGIQSYPELSGQTVEIDPKYWDGAIDTVWELLETIFTGVYILEVLLKLSVYGSRAYFESAKNVFDFTITVLAVATSAIVYYPNQISNSRLIRMVVMARVMRLVRLVTAMERFQLIGAISAEILPKAAGVLLILFSVMYLFAAVGVALYGGMITRDPNDPLSYLVLGTDFSDNGYWANNFNDMVSAMNVLFNLLVINNWTECEIGYEAVTQSKWVRLYFLSFHIIGVILINNLVVAFVINAFLQQLTIFKERVAEEVVDGEAVIHNRNARFNASVITGTKTGLSGGYIARYRHMNSDSSDHEQERLRQLFTRTNSGEYQPVGLSVRDIDLTPLSKA